MLTFGSAVVGRTWYILHAVYLLTNRLWL